ncbi:E3 ubiquitin-protein ligase RFI2-like isoform X1 [Phoenix dactylifera]|uniref:E3 ubiquitin-protein ligase RFI2-like isoform X1 n=1 Tax=Phoenix dactylifera TaxID=42345 RepID=A0A8B7CJX5_PHODC|nr:E3 ubiquitin-protein ligase RFI2-like isoform X1 [Phoenix dactylifera]
MCLAVAVKADAGEEGATTVACSICLETVTSDGDRSTARLQCGHQFHLDCIGSAFNAKGVMQCPNCRKVENGNWLFASSSQPLPELNMGDWAHDEDLYDLSYSEMLHMWRWSLDCSAQAICNLFMCWAACPGGHPFGLHWCPFSRLTRVLSSFEERESSPPIAFQDLLGHHAFFTEHLATSAAAYPGPHVAYLQPLRPSSSSNSDVTAENPIGGSGYHHHWSHIPRPVDVQTAHTLAPTDLQYHGWEHHSRSYSPPNNNISSADQASASTMMRTARLDSDGLLRAGTLVPFILGNGSASRTRVTSSFVPPLVPQYQRVRGIVHDHQNSQSIHGTIFAGIQRSGGLRGLATLGPTPRSLPDHAGFYLLPSAGPSGQNLMDAENPAGNHFYASWERDRFAPYQLFPVDRESGWWGSYPQSTGVSDSSHRVGLWPLTGSERSSSRGWSESLSYQPTHVARMHWPNS